MCLKSRVAHPARRGVPRTRRSQKLGGGKRFSVTPCPGRGAVGAGTPVAGQGGTRKPLLRLPGARFSGGTAGLGSRLDSMIPKGFSNQSGSLVLPPKGHPPGNGGRRRLLKGPEAAATAGHWAPAGRAPLLSRRGSRRTGRSEPRRGQGPKGDAGDSARPTAPGRRGKPLLEAG